MRPLLRINPGACADADELFALRAGGHNLVFPVFLLQYGRTQMGQYKFSSWTLHMASIIIFSSLWGIGLKEWKGSGARQDCWPSRCLLVGSTVIVGYGNYLGMSH